jgi:hypothetical protein
MCQRQRCVTLAAFVCLALPAALVRAEPDVLRNQAAGSPLPSGPGLAAAFAADEGLSSHASVIFADHFERGDLGAQWDEVSNAGNQVLSLVEQLAPDGTTGHRSLQVIATLGNNHGGGLTKWFSSAEQIFIRFYVKFAPDCDYVHHFCTLRANKGLQGRDKWSGFGGAGERPEGDERFSTALEPWGNWGRFTPPGRWNFYSYWHTMKQSGDGRYWGNSFLPEDTADIPRDRWICAEFMLQHNTAGQNDGQQAFWIDGKLLGHWREINWRTSPTLWANAFTLESYVTDRWTKHPVNVVYFDNVVIAKSYIGPAGASKSARPSSVTR